MIKKIVLGVFLGAFLGAATAFAFEASLPPLESSQAYKQFQRQAPSELAKLLFLLNRFKENPDLTIIYDGYFYDIDEAIRLARGFLMKNYKKETADYWIQKYCYKSDKGNVIMVKDKTGATMPVREAILAEMKTAIPA